MMPLNALEIPNQHQFHNSGHMFHVSSSTISNNNLSIKSACVVKINMTDESIQYIDIILTCLIVKTSLSAT